MARWEHLDAVRLPQLSSTLGASQTLIRGIFEVGKRYLTKPCSHHKLSQASFWAESHKGIPKA